MVAEPLGSLSFKEVDRGAQYAWYDVNKFTGEGWSPSLSDIEWAELVHFIYASVEYEDLVALSGAISIFAGSGKKVSASNSVLNHMVQCKQLRLDRFLGYLAEQRRR